MTSWRSREERRSGAHAELVEFVVDGGFFFDVDVGGGDVGFGLVEIVIADEIFDRVFREGSLCNRVKQSCAARVLLLREDERMGDCGLLDHLGHGEGFTGAEVAPRGPGACLRLRGRG